VIVGIALGAPNDGEKVCAVLRSGSTPRAFIERPCETLVFAAP
jgi:hypothetical protein